MRKRYKPRKKKLIKKKRFLEKKRKKLFKFKYSKASALLQVLEFISKKYSNVFLKKNYQNKQVNYGFSTIGTNYPIYNTLLQIKINTHPTHIDIGNPGGGNQLVWESAVYKLHHIAIKSGKKHIMGVVNAFVRLKHRESFRQVHHVTVFKKTDKRYRLLTWDPDLQKPGFHRNPNYRQPIIPHIVGLLLLRKVLNIRLLATKVFCNYIKYSTTYSKDRFGPVHTTVVFCNFYKITKRLLWRKNIITLPMRMADVYYSVDIEAFW